MHHMRTCNHKIPIAIFTPAELCQTRQQTSTTIEISHVSPITITIIGEMLPSKLHPIKPTDNKSVITIISRSKQELVHMPNSLLFHMKQPFRVTQNVAPLTQLST